MPRRVGITYAAASASAKRCSTRNNFNSCDSMRRSYCFTASRTPPVAWLARTTCAHHNQRHKVQSQPCTHEHVRSLQGRRGQASNLSNGWFRFSIPVIMCPASDDFRGASSPMALG